MEGGFTIYLLGKQYFLISYFLHVLMLFIERKQNSGGGGGGVNKICGVSC